MSIDSMGDFLTAIRNALLVSKRTVVVPFSKMKMGVAQVLKDEGFIKDFKLTSAEKSSSEEAIASEQTTTSKDKGGRGYSFLTLYLKYVDGESAIHELKRISKPGRRHYENMKNMQQVIGGLGVSILSTNAGIVTDKQAKKLLVGGEVICHVW